MRYIDLHTHSIFSDGTTTPAGLILAAKEAGLGAISLTDHDTMAGVTAAIEAGRKNGIEVIPGVELSANHDGRAVHVLGYGVDQFHPELMALLDELQEIRKTRNRKILENLAKLGICVDYDELLAGSAGLVGRPHIAGMLVKLKVVRDMEQAFQKYLKKDGLAFADSSLIPAAETIKIINNAGGLAVLAHPTTFDKSLEKIAAISKHLQKYGLAGIEAIYPGHSKKVNKALFAIAENLNLLVTGGSDFHGTIKQGISIGGAPVMPPVPYELLEKLKTRLPGNI